MTEEHTELVAELRALAETVLDRLDPILEKAAAGAVKDNADPTGSDAESNSSVCSWCPLCALAALIRGEQHDLVTHVAAQASIFLAELRDALEAHAAQAAQAADDGPTSTPGEAAAPASPFVPIDVTIKGS
ncbi:hypothetical protein [Rhodococcus spongiicola]|uniref:Uncharacterized protein n=1 Tax=Rhodococcus spongiicola TaxID=2487352 RepID=A0A3S3A612_9NOCA|nr:hypothetical protein [Rhodococcus spongiicola]RVW00334.1 hypothetical protein EF834_16830 [Rhodococcus spongiicola]